MMLQSRNNAPRQMTLQQQGTRRPVVVLRAQAHAMPQSVPWSAPVPRLPQVNPSKIHHKDPWEEVAALQAQLRDAEAETAMYEARLADHDLQSKQLVGQMRQAAMAQASTKLVLKELEGMVSVAKVCAAKEHVQLFAERVHVQGRRFKDDQCRQAFMLRQEQGMRRLGAYNVHLTSLTQSLRAVLEVANSNPAGGQWLSAPDTR